MNFADEIKQCVSMVDLLPYYGIEMDRTNFCKCPFHQEKSASFKAYTGDRGYYCYGCHTSGSVIDFVMQYFSIPFGDAIKKINEDFSLGLPIGEKLDRRKQLEMQKQAFLRKREMNARKAKQEELENAYWAAFEEWKRLDDNKRNYAPKSPTQPLHPFFVEAITKIDEAAYNLDRAEIARYNYEHRDDENPSIFGR